MTIQPELSSVLYELTRGWVCYHS